MTLQPDLLHRGDNSSEILKEGFLVIARSITHSIELIFHELPAKKFKDIWSYPRNGQFFKGIISAGFLDAALDAINLTMKLEGNWLVIAKNDG